MIDKAKKLQIVLEKKIDNKKIFGTSFSVKYRNFLWNGASGNLNNKSRYFIASTTKLFVTAIIMNMRKNNLLSLNDRISGFLSGNILSGIHTLNGVDNGKTITINHLLSHTSGIPDYFELKNSKGWSVEDELKAGRDFSWSFEDALDMSKSIKPLFIPGEKGKAHYSDTNFQLLGRIIENISGKSFSEIVRDLITLPMNMNNTYLFTDINDLSPKNIYFRNIERHIPKAMSSTGPDGGIVSTADDMLIFIESFFTGSFFPVEYIREMKQWNRIFFPFDAGVGIHRFNLPKIFNLFGTIPELIGHAGLSGALAYSCPEEKLFIAGTVNQLANPDLSFRTMISLIHILKKQ